MITVVVNTKETETLAERVVVVKVVDSETDGRVALTVVVSTEVLGIVAPTVTVLPPTEVGRAGACTKHSSSCCTRLGSTNRVINLNRTSFYWGHDAVDIIEVLYAFADVVSSSEAVELVDVGALCGDLWRNRSSRHSIRGILGAQRL